MIFFDVFDSRHIQDDGLERRDPGDNRERVRGWRLRPVNSRSTTCLPQWIFREPVRNDRLAQRNFSGSGCGVAKRICVTLHQYDPLERTYKYIDTSGSAVSPDGTLLLTRLSALIKESVIDPAAN
jgi:hypothetical protein